MVNQDHINIKSLNIDELAGVVNLYPWFGAARKELCVRFSQVGGQGLSETDFASNALYLGSRKILSDIVRSARKEDWSDSNLQEVLNGLTNVEKSTDRQEAPKHRARVIGGDFFSQDEYDSVKDDNDNIFSSFAKTPAVEEKSEKAHGAVIADFCTETLARIYMEQGYFEQAKYIYSQLILRYPEKSAYFASLIEKLAQLTDN